MKLTDALLGEHGAFYAAFGRLEAELPDLDDACAVREQAALLAAALISHAQIEDELLFTELGRRGTGFEDLVKAMFDQHEHIASLLARVQDGGDAAECREPLLEAVQLARDHFAREEKVAFPLAEGVLGDGTLELLGEEWARRRTVWLGEAVRS